MANPAAIPVEPLSAKRRRALLSVDLENNSSEELIHKQSTSKSRKRSRNNSGVSQNIRQIKRRRRLVEEVLIETPYEPMIFTVAPNCKFCKCKRFPREPPGFCCSGGQVGLANHDAPQILWDLFTATTKLAKNFKTYIRTYNNAFAFTSMGVTYDKDLCKRNKGIYTFKAQGQIYHFINSLSPSNSKPSNLQLYFYDTDHELEIRLQMCDRLIAPLITLIIRALENNPYSQFFRSLADLPDLAEFSIVLKNVVSRDQRVYNAPTSSQVAAIWVDGDDGGASNRDIIVYSKPGEAIRIWYYYGCYDSLQYPLLFPLGEPGWHKGIKRLKNARGEVLEGGILPPIITPANVDAFFEVENQVMHDGCTARGCVSCREYYCFKCQIRPDEKSLLLLGGRLTQQFVVDMYIKLESSRLDYLSNQQKRIRADLYSGIVDSIAVGECRGFKIGARIVLPATFIGGPRDLRRRYLDAMTLVQQFGKPDLFITMTCNPNWCEIKRELLPGEEAQNRPDLLSRVFRAKVEELKNDILKQCIFGQVIAYVYVIEFQKRGLPHMHMLVILKQGYRIKSPEQFDRYVTAEIPIKINNPHLHRVVRNNMMHGPCGHLNPQNVCMKDGVCKNHYPKDFCEYTSQTEDSYPLYRRRDNKNSVEIRLHLLNNQWVIPYNPYLLAKFDCHINMEICSTVKAVKYLYKYIYKGHDRVSFHVANTEETVTVNEINNFRDGRWISPPEAMWRIYGFTLNEIYPPVIVLQLHLENNHTVVYADETDLQNLVDSPLCRKTTLTEYFYLNSINTEARKYLYSQLPAHFVWNKSTKIWTPRKQGVAIGRVVSVSPFEGERYYCKLLLGKIKGATSFADLKVFGATTCLSFRESAVLHGLVQEDDCFRNALLEAATYQMPQTLRRLFSTLLVYCNPVNARSLWEEFSCVLSEDFTRHDNVNQRKAISMSLKDINYQLESMGKNINDYLLIDGQVSLDEYERGNKELDDELCLEPSFTDINSVDSLNAEQLNAYNSIMSKVLSSEQEAFFIDGPGGTGKTFLYTVLLATVRSKGLIALATASSGVAAAILQGGRTAHSRFKIPLVVDDQMTCNVSKQSGLAKLLCESRLIIWDEAPMIRRQCIESFDRMLRDICECDELFGGKVVVFGGDFRQLLPVVPKGSMEQTVGASLVKSFLWPMLTKIRLKINMRAQFDNSFSSFLLNVGEGTADDIVDDEIVLPASMTIPYDEVYSLDALIKMTFPDLNMYTTTIETVINRAILSSKNEFVDEINNIVIDRFSGSFYEYRSFDTSVESSQQCLQEDFFNSMTPSGFPPHLLRLKLNCPVMLLRNIDPSKGLCNGTRLICKTFSRNIIGAVIATGTYRGKHVFLPRIPLTPAASELNAFPFKRMQFPLRLCFA